MRSVLWCVISSALLASAASAAQLPDYDGSLELQVRSNIIDGFNLPPNSSFNSKTPSLTDPGRVAVSLGIVGGDVNTVGLWFGGSASNRLLRSGDPTGSLSWLTAQDKDSGRLIADRSWMECDNRFRRPLERRCHRILVMDHA